MKDDDQRFDKRFIEALRNKAVQENALLNKNIDHTLKQLRGTATGNPVAMHSPADLPERWLVPYLAGSKACGFAVFDQQKQLIKTGVLSSGTGGIDSDYFLRPAPRLIEEIKHKYPDGELSTPIFAYDQTPAKWAWRVSISQKGQTKKNIYIMPESWYETEASAALPLDREG